MHHNTLKLLKPEALDANKNTFTGFSTGKPTAPSALSRVFYLSQGICTTKTTIRLKNESKKTTRMLLYTRRLKNRVSRESIHPLVHSFILSSSSLDLCYIVESLTKTKSFGLMSLEENKLVSYFFSLFLS